MNTYFVLTLNLEQYDLDIIEQIKATAIDMGSSGIQEFNIDEARVDAILGERSYSGGDVPESVIQEVEEILLSESKKFNFFFERKENLDIFLSSIQSSLDTDLDHEILEEDEKDWNEEWRKHFKTIEVTDKLSVVPSWELSEIKDNELYIYPGMGFGTGSHETTYLCLKLMLECDMSIVESCLDFGCGSGILGLALLKFKDAKVDLLDIDQEALDNSQMNIDLNKMNDSDIRLMLSHQKDELLDSYDLIFANILKNVLEHEYETLKSCAKCPGTKIIISGLLNHQVDDIVNYYSEFEEIKRVSKGDWSAILMSKK